jgi:hypothetical protein
MVLGCIAAAALESRILMAHRGMFRGLTGPGRSCWSGVGAFWVGGRSGSDLGLHRLGLRSHLQKVRRLRRVHRLRPCTAGLARSFAGGGGHWVLDLRDDSGESVHPEVLWIRPDEAPVSTRIGRPNRRPWLMASTHAWVPDVTWR